MTTETTIEPQLDTLEAKGLIRLAASQPELEYLFRHWLVQDAAYGSLLKQERRELHRQVGNALEKLYPERREELAGMLGLHYEQAGETQKAIEYLVVAGQYGLDRNALQEAFNAFDRAASLLPALAADEDDALRRRRIEVETGRIRSSWSFRPQLDLLADLERILPEAERLGDPGPLAQVYLGIALTRLGLGEATTSPALADVLDRIGEIGARLGDASLRALPLALVGTQQALLGPIRQGVRTLEDAVPLLEERHDFIGAAFARGALAIGYSNLGDWEAAEKAVQHAVELARRGDVIAQLDAAIAQAFLRSARGQLDEAVPLARQCLDRGEEAGATACVVVSSWILGDLYKRQGRLGEARDTLQRGVDLALAVDRKVWRPSLQAWLGSTIEAMGDAAAGNWDEALDMARSIHNSTGVAGILWKRAESATLREDEAAAVSDFAGSAAILEEEGARPNLARVLRAWGDALVRFGRTSEAEERLRRALALFEELDIKTEAAEVRATLEGLPSSAGGREGA
jgi:tetratricopeptide (TPR) repeat protein